MENLEAYQAAVSILLEEEVELVERPETEKELRISPEHRQIRLNVISMDVRNRLYYTEILYLSHLLIFLAEDYTDIPLREYAGNVLI